MEMQKYTLLKFTIPPHMCISREREFNLQKIV